MGETGLVNNCMCMQRVSTNSAEHSPSSERYRFCLKIFCRCRLSTEAVESSALSLQSIDNLAIEVKISQAWTRSTVTYVEGGDSLALGMFSVGDGVTDDGLEERLEDTTGLFVDHG